MDAASRTGRSGYNDIHSHHTNKHDRELDRQFNR
jgi:hypothetical protein